MPAHPLAVLGVGLVSGVGSTAEESCAAIRCGINNFQETQFIGRDGELLVGSAVELEEPWRGIVKLAKMAARAIRECFAAAEDGKPEQVPVLVCIAELERPGRFEGLSPMILDNIERELGLRLHPHSRVIEQGRVGGAVALLQARRMLLGGRHRRMIVAGVDSFLTGATLAAYDRQDRLLRRGQFERLHPRGGRGAVLLAAWEEVTPAPLLVRGLGFAREPAPLDSGRPLRADGLVQAIRGGPGGSRGGAEGMRSSDRRHEWRTVPVQGGGVWRSRACCAIARCCFRCGTWRTASARWALRRCRSCWRFCSWGRRKDYSARADSFWVISATMTRSVPPS